MLAHLSNPSGQSGLLWGRQVKGYTHRFYCEGKMRGPKGYSTFRDFYMVMAREIPSAMAHNCWGAVM